VGIVSPSISGRLEEKTASDAPQQEEHERYWPVDEGALFFQHIVRAGLQTRSKRQVWEGKALPKVLGLKEGDA